MAKISKEELKQVVSHIPAMARAHPGVKALVEFVNKTVNAVNKQHAELEELRAALQQQGLKVKPEGGDA